MESAEKDKLIELASLYILKSIDEEELADLKHLIKKYPLEATEVFSNLNNIDLLLPLAAEKISPSERVRENIFNNLKNEKGYKEPVRTSLFFSAKFAYAAAAAFLICALLIGYGYISLNKEVGIKEKRITELSGQVEQQQAMLEVLKAREIKLVVMNGLEADTTAFGKIIWSNDMSEGIFHIENLPAASNEKDYQLWAIADGKPISWGVFAVSQNNTLLKLKEDQTPAGLQAFAVTLEPKGGVPQPTGPMYLLGNVNL